MLDGRRAERYAMTLPVVLMGTTEAEMGRALMRNISSQGGVFLHVRKGAVPNAEIDFAIALPEQLTRRKGLRVECRATVVRVESDDDWGLVGVAAKIIGLKLAEVHTSGNGPS